MTSATVDDPAAELLTLRDFLRYAVSRFSKAGLAYGHGTSNAFDDAAFLLLEALRLPVDQLEPFLDARLTSGERRRLADLIAERVSTRKPSAYLLGKTYVQGVPFYVDERVIVPRSFIGELLMSETLVGEDGLIPDPLEVRCVLDLCTGSGSLAILAAEVFNEAEVHGVELSAEALAVAHHNVVESGHAGRITLYQGDLFAPLGKVKYDLILTNPPYVRAEAMADLPAEYRHEPPMALDGGADGLDFVRRILANAADHLAPNGALVCEVGSGREALESAYPQTPFTWLDTQESVGEVFWVRRAEIVGGNRQSDLG